MGNSPMPFENRLTPEMVARYTREGYWGTQTFYDLLSARVATRPDREAIVDRKGRISYRQLKDGIDRTAAFLKAKGIGRGDVVTIQLPNWIEFCFVFFALELLGAVADKINPDFRSSEVKYILKFSQSRAYICSRAFKGFDYPGMVRALMPELPDLRFICVVDDEADTADTVSLVAGLKTSAPLPESERVHMDANEIYRMAFTSGTTGNPKCVLHSPNTTIAACKLLDRDMKTTDADVFLIYLPIGLNWGFLMLVEALMLGARVVLLDRFSGRAALELIEREKVTLIAPRSSPCSTSRAWKRPMCRRCAWSSPAARLVRWRPCAISSGACPAA